MRTFLPLLVALVLAPLAHGAENLAQGRPYTLSPAPNYEYCTESGDATQLTDGAYTVGYFWTQPTTVGWSKVSPVVITIDLGADVPIDGVSFSTAARIEAGAHWPRAIFLRVSTDGRQWYDAGELLGLATAQGFVLNAEVGPHGHMARNYRADGLATHGRYIAFVVAPSGDYCFCDEIEVYRGPDSLLSQAASGKALAGPEEGFEKSLSDSQMSQVILADAAAIGRDLAQASLPPERKKAFQDEMLAVLQGPVDAPPLAYYETFPLNETHRKVLELGARVWQALGRPALQAWTACRWDALEPRATPPAGAPAELRVSMMRGEVRGAVLNLTSSLPTPRIVTLELSGMPERVAQAVRVHQVAWTFSGTTAVAAALPEAKRAGAGWQINVPGGSTRQVWLMVDGRGLAPGVHSGSVVLRDGRAEVSRVPFRLRVSRLAMPSSLSLALGGWDYTDGPQLYHLSEPMRHSLVGFLREYGIDAPWATKQVMPFGKHDPDGKMTAPPDTTSMDEWLSMWPACRLYCVFNNFEGNDALGPGLPFGTAEWKRAVGEWLSFWVRYLRGKGIAPDQLCLLLVDEPRNPDTDRLTIAYAEVLRAAEPEVVIWTDPIWQDPADADPRLYELATVIAPQRQMWLNSPARHAEVFEAQQRAGRRLAFYSCSGPVRALDPYTYHLLQAWDCFRRDMDQEFFWSFGGGGGMAPFNQIGPENMVFTPQYRTPERWITSRHMEAVREGRYDYEYLVMLREAIAAAKAKGVDEALVARAQRLLGRAPREVLDAAGADGLWWASEKDRTKADRMREKVLRMVERLGG